MKEQLTNKISLSKLENTEERIQMLIDKVVANINKRFMEKKEIKKTIGTIEKQIRNLIEIMVSKFDEQDVNDAMLSKKPLGGWSCASC